VRPLNAAGLGLLIEAVVLLVGCSVNVYPSGTLLCSASAACPNGMKCGCDGFCWSDGSPPICDAGTSLGSSGGVSSSSASTSGSSGGQGSSGTGSSGLSTSGTNTSTAGTGSTATSSGSTGSSSSGGSCPFNDGGTVYVNAFGGSDMTGTGVASPPQCALRTLTNALAIAGSAGIPSVMAVGANSATSAVFSSAAGETFPLVIPAGVTLTTDQEAFGNLASASVYAIDFDDPTAPSMVDLSPASSIAGFAIECAASGNESADGVYCNAGSVAVADCVIQGRGTVPNAGAGCAVTDACNASLSDVTVQGFPGRGVALSGSSSAAIDGGTIGNNGWGDVACSGDSIYMASDGGLSIQNVTLAGNQDHGLQALSGTVTGSNVTIQGAGSSLGTQAFGIGLGTIAISGSTIPAGCNVEGPASSAMVTLADVTITGVGIGTRGQGQGIEVNAVDGGNLTLLGTVVIADGGGPAVDLQNGTVYLENPTVSLNGASGLNNNTAPGGACTLTVDGGVVGPDGQDLLGHAEVSFQADCGLVLNGTTVQDSPAGTSGSSVGVNLVGSGRYSLTNCDIRGNSGNGLNLAAGGGGMFVAFSGNRIHGNGGNQVYVANGVWHLGSDAGCDGAQNQIYCYSQSLLGLFVDAGQVNANNVSWENATPVAGVDYSGPGNVTAASACAPTSCDAG
jgi:hypothetical protein